MPCYASVVQATSNTSANTEDNFIEITAAASSGVRVYHVEVSCDTPSLDDQYEVRLIRTTAAGATGTAATVVSLDPNMRVTASTVTKKNTTTAFSVGGSPSIIQDVSVNCRSPWEWKATDAADEIACNGATYFVVGIKCTAVSKDFKVTIRWKD